MNRIGIQLIFLFISAGLQLFVLIKSIFHKSELSNVFAIFTSMGLLYTLAHAFQLIIQTHLGKIIFVDIQYIATAFLPLMWYLFFKNFIEIQTNIKTFRLILLMIIPAICLILALTNPLHHFFWIHQRMENIQGNNVYIREWNWGFWIFAIYNYILFLMTFLLSLRVFYSSSSFYRKRVGMVIMIQVFFIIINVLSIALFIPQYHINLMQIINGFIVLGIFYLIFTDNGMVYQPVNRADIFNHIQDAILVFSNEGYLIDYNKSGELILKHIKPTDKLISKKNILSKLTVINVDDEKSEREIYIKSLDKYFHVSNYQLYGFKNQVLSSTMVFHDETLEKKTLEEMKRYKFIIDSMNEWVVILDKNGKIFNANQSMLMKLKRPLKLVLGKNFTDFFQSENMNHLIKKSTAKAMDGISTNFQIATDRIKDNYIEVSFYPYYENQQKTKLAVVVIKDITNLKRTEIKLQNALQDITSINDQLQSSNRDLEKSLNINEQMRNVLLVKEKMDYIVQLFRGLSHEIKNPLNFILNFSDLMTNELENFEVFLEKDFNYLTPEHLSELTENIHNLNEFNEKIHHYGNRLDQVINLLSYYSEISDNQFIEINLESFVKQHFDYVINNLKSKSNETIMLVFLEKINFTIHSNLVEDLFNIPSHALGKVLLNVYHNAVFALYDKFINHTGEYIPQIKITISRIDDALTINILDNGIGITSENIDKLFIPFFTIRKNHSGLGLGLSFSRDIINSVGGTIDIRSEYDVFTEITIQLNIKT